MGAGILLPRFQPKCIDIAVFCEDCLVGPLANFWFIKQSREKKGRWRA